MPYRFGALPIDPLPDGANVVVTGDSMGGLVPLVYRMLAAGHRAGAGTALVSTEEAGTTALNRFRGDCDTFEEARVGIVDCGDGGDHPSVRSVNSPQDLTGTSVLLSKLYEGFEQRDIDRVQTAIVSLSTILTYLDVDTVFRFLHKVVGRVAAMDGLGLYALSPKAHEEQTVNRLLPLFDGRIAVEPDDEGGVLLKLSGFSDRPEEWLELDSLEAVSASDRDSSSTSRSS